MSLLSWIVFVPAVAALIGLAFNLPNSWFFGLLALACMLGGADAAYRELPEWAWAFLATGVLLGAASAHAVYRNRRSRDGT